MGALISRRGDIEHVAVGDASRIMLPAVGRVRAGHGRFRGLRLVHTHLRNEPISRDDLVDLALLRLDLVAAVGVTQDGRPGDLHLAHLMPPREKLSPWTVLAPVPFHRASVDVEELVGALEEEFDRALPATRATSGAERAVLVDDGVAPDARLGQHRESGARVARAVSDRGNRRHRCGHSAPARA